jgi:hypothetical protein
MDVKWPALCEFIHEKSTLGKTGRIGVICAEELSSIIYMFGVEVRAHYVVAVFVLGGGGVICVYRPLSASKIIGKKNRWGKVGFFFCCLFVFVYWM